MVHTVAVWHKTAELVASAQKGVSVRRCISEKDWIASAQQYPSVNCSIAFVYVLAFVDSRLKKKLKKGLGSRAIYSHLLDHYLDWLGSTWALRTRLKSGSPTPDWGLLRERASS